MDDHRVPETSMSDDHILRVEFGAHNGAPFPSDRPSPVIPERPGPEQTESSTGSPAAAAITPTSGDTSNFGAMEGSPDELEVSLQRLAAEIDHGHHQFELAKLDGLRHARYVGERLVHVKSLYPRGQFQTWLGRHCPTLKLRTARYYMWVYLNPERLPKRTGGKRPARVATATTADGRPDHDATGDRPRDGQIDAQVPPMAITRTTGTPASARRDRSLRADDGEPLPEPIGPGPDGDDAPGEPENQTLKPTTAARFVRVCWDLTDTASDTIRELTCGADAQVIDRLRLLVPHAMKSLGEVAVALQIEFPAAMNPADEGSYGE
jgi:hypothetical protein